MKETLSTFPMKLIGLLQKQQLIGNAARYYKNGIFAVFGGRK